MKKIRLIANKKVLDQSMEPKTLSDFIFETENDHDTI